MLKNYLKFFAAFGLIFFGLNAAFYNYNFAYAHGTGYRQSELKAVALEFLYSTGEMMSYRETKVYAPDDDKIAAQAGRTDEFGRFAFVPNKTGEWRVVVTDEEGHRAEAKINITQEFLDLDNENKNNSANNLNQNLISGKEMYIRAALGVSLLFNIAAFILLARIRKGVQN